MPAMKMSVLFELKKYEAYNRTGKRLRELIDFVSTDPITHEGLTSYLTDFMHGAKKLTIRELDALNTILEELHNL